MNILDFEELAARQTKKLYNLEELPYLIAFNYILNGISGRLIPLNPEDNRLFMARYNEPDNVLYIDEYVRRETKKAVLQ